MGDHSIYELVNRVVGGMRGGGDGALHRIAQTQCHQRFQRSWPYSSYLDKTQRGQHFGTRTPMYGCVVSAYLE